MTGRFFSRKALLPLALIFFLLLAFLVVHRDSPVNAQGCTALNSSGSGAWPQGTTTSSTVVTVYLDNSLSGWLDSNEVNAVKEAFSNWSAEAAQSATGCNCHVSFQRTRTLPIQELTGLLF